MLTLVCYRLSVNKMQKLKTIHVIGHFFSLILHEALNILYQILYLRMAGVILHVFYLEDSLFFCQHRTFDALLMLEGRNSHKSCSSSQRAHFSSITPMNYPQQPPHSSFIILFLACLRHRFALAAVQFRCQLRGG